MENRVSTGKTSDKPQQPAVTSPGAIDSLLDSTEDLNSIRDGYLRRLAGEGCRPDVANRVAELRSQLDENGSRGPARNATIQQTNFQIEGALLLLAAGWYQMPAEAAQQKTSRDAERTRQLEYVLSPGDGSVEAAPSGAGRAQLKAELDRLLATCHGAGR
jgi:hypothetical protein